jgi:RimJ/RimL family protein N-acetyltransferase
MKGLKVRDARPGDKKAVLEFCRNTWPGYGDYIESVWGRWIRDRGGRFLLAELNGKPVGTAKMSEFSKGEIWLQGLRVDPALRGMGIANEINREVLRTVKRMKPRVVRFCTGTRNRASRHIGEKFGFTLTARFRFFWGKSRRGRIKGTVAGIKHLDAADEFIKGSRFLRFSGGLIAEGWVFRELTRDVLREYIRAGAVMLIVRKTRKPGEPEIRGLAIYAVDREDADTSVSLGFVDGDVGSIKALARNAFYLAAARGLPYCSAALPTRYFTRLLRRPVFGRSESIGQVIYQLGADSLRRM